MYRSPPASNKSLTRRNFDDWRESVNSGLVSLVYPAAHHTRFEHSLGVYRLALLYLKQLAL